ncbi:MAG: L,D-transpeptidase [Clostridiaceae bacterium]|nr:L,D-transpeptidase [Clostridiaceae bacterium]
MKATEKDTSQKITDKNTGRRFKKIYLIAGIALGAALVLIAAVMIGQRIYYSGRWYKNTMVNGIDISGQTFEESKEKLGSLYQDYTLTITGRNDGELVLDGDDFSFAFQIGEDFEQLFEEQHSSFPFFPQEWDYTINYDVSYDIDTLKSLIAKSELVSGSPEYSINEPVSAYVKYSKAKKQYVCVEENNGNAINRNTLISKVEELLKEAVTEMDLTDEDSYPDIYKQPAVTSDSDTIQSELDLCNNAAVRFIVWKLGDGYTEKITPSLIAKWITCKNGKIKYNNSAIESWVEKFCLKYKTVGKTRKVTMHNGKTVKVYGGDYGWQLDYEKMVKRTKKLLKAEIDTSLTNAYIEDPGQENKAALTFRKKVTYLNTAYQMNFDKYPSDWDTENYTEVSIKNQKVYVFRKGKVVFSCKCITGRPVEGRSTPTGSYFIKEHRTAYTLTGADYSTPVKNWVRITWTGTGFHPATWQPWSQWTKTMYKTRGSHGCINLSVEDAEKIYKLTKYREAVFIYE